MDLSTPLFGNPLSAWLSAAGIALALLLLALLVRQMLLTRVARLAARTSTSIDDSLIEVVRSTRLWLLAVVALSIGIRSLVLPERVAAFAHGAAVIALFLQIGLWLSRLMAFWIGRSRTRALATDAVAATSLSAMSFIGRMVLWSVLLLVVLDNLGVDITTLIAGLGIGGIAVALAVQNILGDLFASLSIVIDKPFVIGDFIVVDAYAGTVEHIGLKTTRIRSLGGEQLIFANSDLLSTRVRNYKRMQERRIVFKFGVVYDTPADQLEAIPPMVREIVDGQKETRFERAHFQGFGESSYDFEVVYWMTVPDYNAYMDVQERINLGLVRAFERAGIEFAFPTRTVHIAGGGEGTSSAATPQQRPAAAAP